MYDVEIVRCIPSGFESGEELNAYEYCGGWDDHKNMGISIVTAYDMTTGRPRIFMQDNLAEFQELVKQREIIAGFNTIGFDDKLMAANGVTVKSNYDILVELRLALGEPAEYTRGVTRGGRNLDAIVESTLGLRKTGDGARAPKLWQDGKHGQLCDYGMNDAFIEALLFDACPILVDPVTKKHVILRDPKTLLSSVQGAAEDTSFYEADEGKGVVREPVNVTQRNEERDHDGPDCPNCGGKMWDNRVSKRNPKAPDFKCRDRTCEGVIWPPRSR